MDRGKKRTQRDYTLAFKRAVVDEVERGDLSYRQAQRRYGIQGRSTVLTWLRKHGRRDWVSVSGVSPLRSGYMSRSPREMSPEQQIKALEVELAQAQEKAALFEAMLDVIRQEYGVKLPKKPSGGCSSKGGSKA